MKTNSKTTISLGRYLVPLAIVLSILKLFGVAELQTVSWWLILLPFYFWVLFVFVFAFGIMLLMAVVGILSAIIGLFSDRY